MGRYSLYNSYFLIILTQSFDQGRTVYGWGMATILHGMGRALGSESCHRFIYLPCHLGSAWCSAPAGPKGKREAAWWIRLIRHDHAAQQFARYTGNALIMAAFHEALDGRSSLGVVRVGE